LRAGGEGDVGPVRSEPVEGLAANCVDNDKFGFKEIRNMCLAIPALVKSIDGAEAEVEIGGVVRRASILLTPDVKVGDYVLLHTGYAINTIDEEEAQETLKLFREFAEG